MWNIGGMSLTGENGSALGNSCPIATSSTTNLMWTELGSNPRLRVEGTVTDRVSRDTNFKGLN